METKLTKKQKDQALIKSLGTDPSAESDRNEGSIQIRIQQGITWYVLSNLSYMKRVMMLVLPTDWSPRKTSLYLARAEVGAISGEISDWEFRERKNYGMEMEMEISEGEDELQWKKLWILVWPSLFFLWSVDSAFSFALRLLKDLNSVQTGRIGFYLFVCFFPHNMGN